MARSREPEQNVTTVARLDCLVSDVPEVLPIVRYRVTNGHQLLKPTLQPLTHNGHTDVLSNLKVQDTWLAGTI